MRSPRSYALAVRILVRTPAGPLLFALTLGAPVFAHEHHTPPPPTTALAPSTPEATAPAAAERPVTEPLTIDPAVALTQHLHNKVVHFPFALGLMGAILLLLSYRWPQFGPGARLLLVVAALTAWIAVRSGIAQEEDLEGGELQIWLDRHELAGKWTAAVLTLTAALALVPRARPIHWLLALLVMGLLSLTGFLGGILAHTPV
jgi:uncharacterized membrane protein